MNVHLYRTRLPDTKLDAGNYNGEKCATYISGKKKLCDVLQKKTCFMALLQMPGLLRLLNHLLCILYILLMAICSRLLSLLS